MRQLMMGCVAASVSAFGSADFTFTGAYTWVQDSVSNWRLKFLTSGVFTPKKGVVVDIFLLAGGAGGGNSNGALNKAGGGGGGGRTGTVYSKRLNAGQGYSIVIGAGAPNHSAGGDTHFYGEVDWGVAGGSAIVESTHYEGTSGGSGGGAATRSSGGSNGGDGGSGDRGSGGTGQHTTTYEFGDASLTLYAGGGGGGGGAYPDNYSAGAGGLGGGANGGGGWNYLTNGNHAAANTGGGGGGAGVKSGQGASGGWGGSGIVVIRNKRG